MVVEVAACPASDGGMIMCPEPGQVGVLSASGRSALSSRRWRVRRDEHGASRGSNRTLGGTDCVGHSDTPAPPSMHSAGLTRHWPLPSEMQSTGQTGAHAVLLARNAACQEARRAKPDASTARDLVGWRPRGGGDGRSG